LTPFLTIGAFPLQQSNPAGIFDFSQHSKWLYAGQVGLAREYRTGVSARVGVAYYHFDNITGVFNVDPVGHPGATDWSAPLFQQKGNTLFDISGNQSGKTAYASGFKELNLIGTLDIGYWDPYHVVFLGDCVKNFGFNQDKVNAVASYVDDNGVLHTPLKQTLGYQFGMSVGHQTIQEFGQWKLFFNYKHLEADAVVDAFTDSDFHLGGTNAKGWILGTDFGLWKNSWLTLRWLTAHEINGPPLGIDVLQVDFNARF
jgi:hypothetical protein